MSTLQIKIKDQRSKVKAFKSFEIRNLEFEISNADL
jgi:hypothetical protein